MGTLLQLYMRIYISELWKSWVIGLVQQSSFVFIPNTSKCMCVFCGFMAYKIIVSHWKIAKAQDLKDWANAMVEIASYESIAQ